MSQSDDPLRVASDSLAREKQVRNRYGELEQQYACSPIVLVWSSLEQEQEQCAGLIRERGFLEQQAHRQPLATHPSLNAGSGPPEPSLPGCCAR